MNGKDNNDGTNGSDSKIVSNGESQKGVMNGERDEDDESKSLLLPRRGGLSKKSQKRPRKVQWNDTNGHNLTEVLEYQPSEDSDSDDDEDSDSCICNIM